MLTRLTNELKLNEYNEGKQNTLINFSANVSDRMITRYVLTSTKGLYFVYFFWLWIFSLLQFAHDGGGEERNIALRFMYQKNVTDFNPLCCTCASSKSLIGTAESQPLQYIYRLRLIAMLN